MKKFICAVFLSALILVALTACGDDGNNANNANANDGNANEEKTLSVVTTIFPEYDWVRQILGDKADHVDLTLLLDSGVDLHSYQPTVEDMVKISSCDLFVYVGGESDEWVEDALSEAVNQDMTVINLLDVLGDAVKEEEVVEGMQEEEHDHSHGNGQFEDSDVKDRELSDWYGDWQSVYPYLLNGTLDPVMEHKAESGDMTAQEYKEYYTVGYKTDVERIVIDEDGIEFFTDGKSVQSAYQYRGFQIYDYESGSRGVRFFFEAEDASVGAPKYVQFSDHEISPTKAEHFHLYWGDESFDALSGEMENWPTYYPSDLTAEEIVEEMTGHEHGDEEAEYDEHVWLSLKNARILCGAIADALIALSPDDAQTFTDNLNAYQARLNELDAQYENTVSEASVKTLLFGDRFPFRYLTDDYGLNYYAAFVGCSAETEASFETVVFLANKVDELNLSSVLTIETSDGKIARTIIENTAAKSARVLQMDSMQAATSYDVSNGETYLDAMERNLEVLRDALK